MSVYQRIKAAITIPPADRVVDLDTWRHWLMNTTVTLAVIFTLPIYLLLILPAERSQGHHVLIWMELGGYALGGWNIVTKGRTFLGFPLFWAISIQVVMYPLFYEWGPGFLATAWMVMCSVLWAVYYGLLTSVLSVVVNIILLSVMYYWLSPHTPEWIFLNKNFYIGWPSYLAMVSWIALVAGVSAGFLLQRMERALKSERRSKAQFQESAGRFRGVFQSNPNGIMVSDMNGLIIEVNKAFIHHTGYSRDDVLGRPMTEMMINDRPDSLEMRMAALKAGVVADSPYELKYRKKDGTVSFALARGWVVPNEQGDPVAIGVHFRDITNEKILLNEKSQLEMQLRQAQKMEAIGTLAGGIAHDFNNILSGVIGYAELAQIELDVTQCQSKVYVSRMLEGGQRARDLVRQILRFSRQDESVKGPLSVSAVVKEVVALMQSTLPSTIRIEARVDKRSLMIIADPTQIHQVVMNLCTNAYQAMRARHGTLGIVLEKIHLEKEKRHLSMTIAPGDYVRLRVSDTGEGIPNGIMTKIFDPYFTTKSAGAGTGLGLSVTVGVVKDHGGLIEAHSSPQDGTIFDVYLPFEQKAANAAAECDASIRNGSNEQIMVVDDEPFFLDVVNEHLHSLGYEVEAFSNSQTAIERFQHAPDRYHLVISDQTMPEMTGLELLSAFRKMRGNIPFIICTGYSDPDIEKKLRQMDNLTLLMKPLTRRELAVAVYEGLHRRPDGFPPNTTGIG